MRAYRNGRDTTPATTYMSMRLMMQTPKARQTRNQRLAGRRPGRSDTFQASHSIGPEHSAPFARNCPWHSLVNHTFGAWPKTGPQAGCCRVRMR